MFICVHPCSPLPSSPCLRIAVDNQLPTIAAAAALATACGVLSTFVVARRWAFLGEGIGHGGFGGAGLAWLLSLAVPSLDQPWLPTVGVIAFGLASALAVGFLSDRGRANGDAAIGIVMVAGLALGLLARQVYQHVRHADPAGFNDVLFGQLSGLSGPVATATVTLAAAVLLVTALLAKELVAYAFDPALARTAGVRVGLVHYTLLLLVAVTILTGIRLLGGPLVTALLVIPGTAARRAGRRLSTTVGSSVAVALAGTLGGVLAHVRWPFVPPGPAVVIALLAALAACYAVPRTARAGDAPV